MWSKTVSIIFQEKSLAGKFTPNIGSKYRLLTCEMLRNAANNTCTSTPLKKGVDDQLIYVQAID